MTPRAAAPRTAESTSSTPRTPAASWSSSSNQPSPRPTEPPALSKPPICPADGRLAGAVRLAGANGENPGSGTFRGLELSGGQNDQGRSPSQRRRTSGGAVGEHLFGQAAP